MVLTGPQAECRQVVWGPWNERTRRGMGITGIRHPTGHRVPGQDLQGTYQILSINTEEIQQPGNASSLRNFQEGRDLQEGREGKHISVAPAGAGAARGHSPAWRLLTTALQNSTSSLKTTLFCLFAYCLPRRHTEIQFCFHHHQVTSRSAP